MGLRATTDGVEASVALGVALSAGSLLEDGSRSCTTRTEPSSTVATIRTSTLIANIRSRRATAMRTA